MNHHSVKFVLMVSLWWMISASAMAAELRSWVQCPGGSSFTVSGKHLWQVVGESSVGVMKQSSKNLTIGFLAAVSDLTPPTTPVVSDDGEYTRSANQLHANWTSDDRESGIAECQYAIGTSQGGTQTLPWSSAGSSMEVTQTGLHLANGVIYYVSVKAKNKEGIWSSVGNSDGIVVDTQPPVITITSPTDGAVLEPE